VRLPDGTAERLRIIADLEHRSLAETVRLLTEEALAIRAFPDSPSNRRPRPPMGPF
jgi:hypothetical protein